MTEIRHGMCAVFLASCSVTTMPVGIDDSALPNIQCSDSSGCPSGFVCVQEAGRCFSARPSDTTAPVVTSVVFTPTVSRPGVRVTFEVTVDESLTAFVLDGGDAVSLDEPRRIARWERTVTDEASSRFQATLVDASGNVSRPSPWVVPFDDTGPVVARVEWSDSGVLGASSMAEFVAEFETGSFVQTAELLLNSDSILLPIADVLVLSETTLIGTLELAEYALTDVQALSVRVTLLDAAGNMTLVDWPSRIVDALPPTTSLLSVPPPVDTQRRVSISFTTDEAGSQTECSLDGASFALCASPWEFVVPHHGVTQVAVRPTDEAGNVGPEATHQWSIEPQWESVVASGYSVCGLTEEGSIWCWGFDEPVTGGSVSHVKTKIEPELGWESIEFEGGTLCAERRDGGDPELWCWGNLAFSEEQSTAYTPQPLGRAPWQAFSVSDPSNFTSEAGARCIIETDGSLWCWGDNVNGNIGHETPSVTRVPTRVGLASDWFVIDTGSKHTCGIRGSPQTGGTLWCWGQNPYGELGLGDTTARFPPTQVGVESDWLDVRVGAFGIDVGPGPSLAAGYTCGVRGSPQAGGTLWCWGAGSVAQIANAIGMPQTTPLQVGTRNDWTGFRGGAQASPCAATAADGVYCWGTNREGSLTPQIEAGGPEDGAYRSPVAAGTWDSFASNATNACGIRQGELECWGTPNLNGLGELTYFVPDLSPIAEPGPWTQVEFSGNFGVTATCGLKEEGSLWCWGEPSTTFGLATTDYLSVSTPTRVGMDTDWVELSVGNGYACGIRDTAGARTLWCWGGGNTYGQLGLGPGFPDGVPQPTQVGAETDWQTVKTYSVGPSGLQSGTWGIRESTPGERTLWYWGQQGHRSTLVSPEDSPAQLGTDTDWQQLFRNACAVKTDTSLHCWLPSGNNPVLPAQVEAGTAYELGWLHSADDCAVRDAGAGATETICFQMISIANNAITEIRPETDWRFFDGKFGIRTDDSLWHTGEAWRPGPDAGATFAEVSGFSVRSHTSRNNVLCVVTQQGDAYCAGNGSYGVLGQGRYWGSILQEVPAP